MYSINRRALLARTIEMIAASTYTAVPVIATPLGSEDKPKILRIKMKIKNAHSLILSTLVLFLCFGASATSRPVEIGGYDRSCSTDSGTTTAIQKKAETRKFDEYGALKQEEENERLDNFLIELMNDPQTKGYIIAYNGGTSPSGQARRAAEMMKSYLVDTRHFEPERMVVVDGGVREKTTFELWVVPAGAVAPPLTPIKLSELCYCGIRLLKTPLRSVLAKRRSPLTAKPVT
jgi:hypothetical protein